MARWWVIVAMALLAACGSPTPSTAPATTPAAGLCQESVGAASAGVLAYDGVAAQFGPLAPAPTLDVTVPALTAVRNDQTRAHARVVARLVNHGALVGFSADGTGEADSSVLAVVDTDGTRRWVRCLPANAVEAWVAAPAERPTTALVSAYHNTGTTDWQLVALDTGRTTTGFADAARRIGVDPSTLTAVSGAVSPTAVLLARWARAPGSDTTHIDLLLSYDLVKESLTVVPAPSPDGHAGFEYQLRTGDDVVATSGRDGVVAVYHQGLWRRDEATRRAARPVEVRFGSIPGPSTLRGIDAFERVVWQRDELFNPVQEGVQIVTDGPVTLANVCVEPNPDTSCNRGELVGVDTATGAVRWRLGGGQTVVTAADGWALVTDGVLAPRPDGSGSAPGYLMIDDRTGTVVDGTQHWPVLSFAEGCCGADLWIERAGSVIFAGRDDHLRVWYAEANWQGTTATLSLP